MTKNPIRIGTRDSKLAMWQAITVKSLIESLGLKCELVPVKSEGDIDLVTPLYAMGVEGIFTKTLDAALLNNRIDIAVHSMKDVPTQLAAGIAQGAVLKRGPHEDVLIKGKNAEEKVRIIGTGSTRRSAMWLNKFPEDTIENLRGNVQTRLQKLENSNWIGAIFAKAGLERLGILPADHIELDWMLPAPAQGAIVIVFRETDHEIGTICAEFDDDNTALCTKVEKDFLKTLMGGCSTPISAYARTEGNMLHFDGNILSIDGKKIVKVSKSINAFEALDLGTLAGKEVLENGGLAIVKEIRDADLTD